MQEVDAHCPCCGAEVRAVPFSGRERQIPVDVPTVQRYASCDECGSWFAVETEADFSASRHYPAQYYSFIVAPDSVVTRFLRGERVRHSTSRGRPLGWLISRAIGVPADLEAFGQLGAQRSDRILDVGAGAGRLVRDLYAGGFRHVTGCDAFGPDQIGPPVLIRGDLAAVRGAWDVIMYHHCLEHIDDPMAELRRATQRLSVEGKLLVRVPLTDSDAAAEYGDRWVQLDAPRHRVIPSAAGVRAMAARAGLIVEREWRDSSAFQFWGSELYRRDVALQSLSGGPSAHFSRAALKTWALRARQLNLSSRGDQGVFILRRASSTQSLAVGK